MEKLSLLEFKNRCIDLSFGTFIFATDNQIGGGNSDIIRSEFLFKNMIITFNPNTIFLRDKTNFLQLNKIKTINLHEEYCPLGQIFTVVCGNPNDNLNDKKFTFIAR